jgi:uncharacterized membrane protein
MGILSKLLAVVVMGLIACFVIGVPVNMIAGAGQSGTSSASLGLLVALAATLLVAFTSSSPRSAWGRLFLVNGLASLALP